MWAARPRYRDQVDSNSLLPVVGLYNHMEIVSGDKPLISTPSAKMKSLITVVIWDAFFKTCEDIGKELLNAGAIRFADIDAWKHAFFALTRVVPLDSSCVSDNIEITSVNRPEGRAFEWLYDPMCIMKEQIRSLDLQETEELYFHELCLYSGDTRRIESWQNGSIPPQDEIRRAQLEGMSRRLQGFCLMLSRLPTSRRRFYEVVKVMEHLAKNSEEPGVELIV
ncbi:unnamed protein product [Ilex paraguariensis]|uniref:NR LBD domain-containing protein n=1 Tax=Ilex paraguariensis TaxID=185542 RepID=A0ABC8TAE7_9AQUA